MPSPPSSPSRARRRRATLRRRPRPLLGLLPLSLLAAGCGPGLQPNATPSPDVPVAPVPAAPTAAAFAYGAGSAVALVESRATIDVADDSSAARDTVVTTARVRWQIAEPAAGGERRLTAVVDSFTVRAGGRVPAAAMPLPVRVEGVASGGLVRLGTPVGPPAPPPPLASQPSAPGAPGAPGTPGGASLADDPCAAPAAAVLGSVRELFPPLPARLAPGDRWSDTVTTTACPGGVRLVTTALHRYAVAGEAGSGGRRALRLERTSELLVRGEGEQARQRVTADGRGSARATLLVDVAAGRLAELTGESTLVLTFTGAGRVQRVEQRAATTVRVSQP